MAFISVRFQVFFCLFLQLYIQSHETPFYTTNNCLHFYPRAFVLLPSAEMFFSLLNTALCVSICPLSIWVKFFLGEKSPNHSLQNVRIQKISFSHFYQSLSLYPALHYNIALITIIHYIIQYSSLFILPHKGELNLMKIVTLSDSMGISTKKYRAYHKKLLKI